MALSFYTEDGTPFEPVPEGTKAYILYGFCIFRIPNEFATDSDEWRFIGREGAEIPIYAVEESKTHVLVFFDMGMH